DLIVASPRRPDLTALVEQAGWPTTATWDTRDYGPVLDRIAPGQRWRFRLAANPTRSVRMEANARRSQRPGHVTVSQQQAWLLSRAERAGFRVVQSDPGDGAVPDLVVHNRQQRTFQRQGQPVTLSTAAFDGQL